MSHGRPGLRWWTGGSLLLLVFLIGVLPVLLALGQIPGDLPGARRALTDAILWRRLGTTLQIAALTLVIAVPVGLLLAWLLTRTDLPFRGGLRFLTPLPLFLPPLVHVVSWFGLTGWRGMPAIVLVDVLSFLPFIVLSAGRAFDEIGRDHAESVRLVGGRAALLRDELRQGWPAAAAGGALILVFLISEFAVADFLTAVGPKISVYADSLHAHQLGWRPGAAAAAALPGMAICLLALGLALRHRRWLGASVDGRFERADPLELGGWRWPAFGFAAAIVSAGSILPLVSLAAQTGSPDVFLEQARLAGRQVVFSLQLGIGVATAMVLLALPLAWMASRPNGSSLVALLVFLPLATPALLCATGQTLTWNRAWLDAVYAGPWMLGVALTGRYLAFACLPLGAAMARLDPALDEAGRLAGAPVWSRRWHLELPLLRRALFTAWGVSFAFTLREVDTLFMLGPGQRTLAFHLQANIVFARSNEVAALALLLLLITVTPLLLLMVAERRRPKLV